MARLIVKSPYIKCGGGNSAGGYMRYIATRERVELIQDDRPPTRKQEQLIAKLVKDFPDAKELMEYEDYLSHPTKATASALITLTLDPVLTLVLVIALVMLINHTKIGMAMRAASRDFETAQLMGIKINNVISFTFVIGSLLAAVGSALYFTNYPSIVPLSGSLPGLRAFVAAVFGGIGSIPGAVVGAFLIGLSETVIKSSNWSVFSDAFTFALLIIILVVKPTGLFGEKSTDKV